MNVFVYTYAKLKRLSFGVKNWFYNNNIHYKWISLLLVSSAGVVTGIFIIELEYMWDIHFFTYFGAEIRNHLHSFFFQQSFETFRFIVIASIILFKIVCVLISVAYFTIAERKIMAAIQRRKGPEIVGAFGLLQPLADGLKLLIKKVLLPARANVAIFLLAPILLLTLSLLG